MSSSCARERTSGVRAARHAPPSRGSAFPWTEGRHRTASVDAAARSAPDQAPILVELLHESVCEDSVDVDALREAAVLEEEVAERDVAVAAHRADATRPGQVVLRRLDLRVEHVALVRAILAGRVLHDHVDRRVAVRDRIGEAAERRAKEARDDLWLRLHHVLVGHEGESQSGHAVRGWVEEADRYAEASERVGLVRGEDGVHVDAAVGEHARIEPDGDLAYLRAIDAADRHECEVVGAHRRLVADEPTFPILQRPYR